LYFCIIIFVKLGKCGREPALSLISNKDKNKNLERVPVPQGSVRWLVRDVRCVLIGLIDNTVRIR